MNLIFSIFVVSDNHDFARAHCSDAVLSFCELVRTRVSGLVNICVLSGMVECRLIGRHSYHEQERKIDHGRCEQTPCSTARLLKDKFQIKVEEGYSEEPYPRASLVAATVPRRGMAEIPLIIRNARRATDCNLLCLLDAELHLLTEVTHFRASAVSFAPLSTPLPASLAPFPTSSTEFLPARLLTRPVFRLPSSCSGP